MARGYTRWTFDCHQVPHGSAWRVGIWRPSPNRLGHTLDRVIESGFATRALAMRRVRQWRLNWYPQELAEYLDRAQSAAVERVMPCPPIRGTDA